VAWIGQVGGTQGQGWPVKRGRHAATAFDFFPTAGLIKERCRTHTKTFGSIELNSTGSDAAREV
jgi:hypothetical protein